MKTTNFVFLTSKISLILITGLAFVFAPFTLFSTHSTSLLVYAQSTSGIAVDTDSTTHNYSSSLSTVAIETSEEIKVDEEIQVAIVAQAVTNLDSYVGKLIFDTEKLQFVSGKLEDTSAGIENLLKNNGGVLVDVPVVEHTAGEIIFGGALKGQDTTQAPEGSGVIALITFKALESGDVTLALHDVIYTDSSFVEYPITNVSYAVLHILGSATVTPTATISPTLAIPLWLPDYLPATGLDFKTLLLPCVMIGISIIIAYRTTIKHQEKKHGWFETQEKAHGNREIQNSKGFPQCAVPTSSFSGVLHLGSVVLVIGLVLLNLQTFSQTAPLSAEGEETSTSTETVTQTPTYTETSTMSVTSTQTISPTVTQTIIVSPTTTATLTSIPNTGRLKGVTRLYSTPLAGVSVSALKSPDWQVVATATTQSDGTYVLANLVPTNYRIKFDLTGYSVTTVYFRNKLVLETAAIISVFAGEETINIDLELSDVLGTPSPTQTANVSSPTATPTLSTQTPVGTATPSGTPDCDFNNDQNVYLPDLILFADHYLTRSSDDTWLIIYDLQSNGVVDEIDLGIFKQHWLEGI